MANHGYIKLEKAITVEELYNLTADIIDSRFNGDLVVETTVEDDQEFLNITLQYQNHQKEYVHTFWISDNGKSIEFRHGNPPPFDWVETIIKHQIAHKLCGTISDDGCGGIWKPDISKFPTYRSWLEGMHVGKKIPWSRRRWINKTIQRNVKELGPIFDDKGD